MSSLPPPSSPHRDTSVLPPAGPAWAGSLMGTSITASLLQVHGWHLAAEVFLILAGTVAVVIALGWSRFRSPKFEPTVMPAWAMVSMGLLALGSAVSAIFGDSAFGELSWWFHLFTWVVGGLLGLSTCLIYLPVLLKGNAGSPTFSWGLPLVAPMVTSTVGMQLHTWLSHRDTGPLILDAVLWISLFLFFLSLVLAVPVFARVYLYYFSPQVLRSGKQRMHQMAAPTTWIPLGVVGQSTAAAQLLGTAMDGRSAGIIYGAIMLGIGVPLAALALRQHYRAAFTGIDYSPTWWSTTFPVGTCCLGSHALSITTGTAWLNTLSIGLLALLLVHVCWSGSGFLRAVGSRILRPGN